MGMGEEVHGSHYNALGAGLRIQWAAHRLGSAIEHMGVDHCGFDIFVTEQFLFGTNVVDYLREIYYNHSVYIIKQALYAENVSIQIVGWWILRIGDAREAVGPCDR